jgi:hypothetical protein
MRSAVCSEHLAMPPPDPIAEYLNALTYELRFDPVLAQRVRQEVDDHLRQAADEAGDGRAPPDAQLRAIARFGDGRAIARQYAPSALLAQLRRAGVVVLIALAGIYAMMKGRLAWYDFTQWSLSPDVAAAVANGFSLVRWVFIIALGLAVVGAAYIGSRRPPQKFHKACHRQLLCCVALCASAAVALLIAIGLDGILLGLRMVGRQPSIVVVVPIVSMILEASLAVLLVRTVAEAIQRTVAARALLLRDQ